MSIAQMWPVSTDVKVTYDLADVTSPVDVSVAVFDGDAEVNLEGTGNTFLRGEVYGVSSSGRHVLYLDPTQLKSVMPSFTASFKVRLSLSESAANIGEAIYKIVDLNDGSVVHLTRADIKNGLYGTWTDDMESTFGLTNSVDDLLVWTGVTNDVRWARDKMVFRKIPASGKTFRIGAQEGEVASATREKAYTATLSRDYWMGVFEVTQYQFRKLSGGANYSYFSEAADADLLPAENMSWTALRGGNAGLGWTADAGSIAAIRSSVESDSCIGRLRTKNAGAFANLDLPSEVQWEVAARAGVMATFYDGYLSVNNNESTAGAHFATLGRYADNGGLADGGATTNGPARVGSYRPNQYGLYDVLGNVGELTGDVFMETPAGQTVFPGGTEWLDPMGGLNGDDEYDGGSNNRTRSAVRGGGWMLGARSCSVTFRQKANRLSAANYIGFRLCITED